MARTDALRERADNALLQMSARVTPCGASAERGLPNARSDTVSRIGTDTNEVIQTIRVGGGPVVFTRAFGGLWLTHFRGTLWRLRVG